VHDRRSETVIEGHIEVTWLYLSRYPLVEALSKCSEGIKRLASSFGVPGKYHATITWAYVFLIAERIRISEHSQSFSQFRTDNPDLLTWPSKALTRYYRSETLWSDRARSQFVLPDRGIPLPTR